MENVDVNDCFLFSLASFEEQFYEEIYFFIDK